MTLIGNVSQHRLSLESNPCVTLRSDGKRIGFTRIEVRIYDRTETRFRLKDDCSLTLLRSAGGRMFRIALLNQRRQLNAQCS
jgi:hypothetical protein